MARTRPRTLTVVLTATSSDAHTWNLVYLQLLMEELGHDVVNLGPCVPDELVADRCAELRPDLLVVSSVNGHGGLDGRSLIRAVRARPATTGLPAVIGGKLGTSLTGLERAVDELIAAGFDAVFDESVSMISFTAFVARLSLAEAA